MMSKVKIATIVEGEGDKESVQILIRRIAQRLGVEVECNHPIRISVHKLRKEEGLEKAVDLAARKLSGQGRILILLDCDWKDSCPAQDGPKLLKRARQKRPDIPISVVLARYEFEAWFIASISSLAGKRGLGSNIDAEPASEQIRSAKEWIDRQMVGKKYSEVRDQPALTMEFDMDLARKNSDSFDKCYREIVRLLKIEEPSPGSNA